MPRAWYAGETVVWGAFLLDKRDRPLTPQPDGGVKLTVKSEDEATTHTAQIAMTLIARDTGTASAGAAKSLTDSTKAWPVDKWKGLLVKTTGGTGSGQERRVKSNTATVLTLEDLSEDGGGAWATTPDATTTYSIHEANYEKGATIPTGATDTVIKGIVEAIDSTYSNKEKVEIKVEPDKV